VGQEPAPAALGYAVQRLGRSHRRRSAHVSDDVGAPQRPARPVRRQGSGRTSVRPSTSPHGVMLGRSAGPGQTEIAARDARKLASYLRVSWRPGVLLPSSCDEVCSLNPENPDPPRPNRPRGDDARLIGILPKLEFLRRSPLYAYAECEARAEHDQSHCDRGCGSARGG
jgi:hypothetical protein